MWSQHVGNENVQIIYWHCLTGGLMELVPPLIHYYYGKMDAFRESARKLFGLKGLYVSAYTTPRNSLPAPPVPVILNFTAPQAGSAAISTNIIWPPGTSSC